MRWPWQRKLDESVVVRLPEHGILIVAFAEGYVDGVELNRLETRLARRGVELQRLPVKGDPRETVAVRGVVVELPQIMDLERGL